MIQLQRFCSPLRYPGGKADIATYLAETLIQNQLQGAVLLEPFCGGLGATLPLLYAGLVSQLIVNDLNPGIYAFWKSLLETPDAFIQALEAMPVNLEQWHTAREIYRQALKGQVTEPLRLGLATFFLNRSNRSGILYAGPIGGQDQSGPYKLDCRFDKKKLILRLEKIASFRQHIQVWGQDAQNFFAQAQAELPKSCLRFAFVDPPYIAQGKNVYSSKFSYKIAEHGAFAQFLQNQDLPWLATYDYHPELETWYSASSRQTIQLSYHIHSANLGREFVISNLDLPKSHRLQSSGKD